MSQHRYRKEKTTQLGALVVWVKSKVTPCNFSYLPGTSTNCEYCLVPHQGTYMADTGRGILSPYRSCLCLRSEDNLFFLNYLISFLLLCDKNKRKMPPESDGIRTVGCSVSKLIPNEEHLAKIQGAVAATHKATILATELLNIHLRRCLEEDPYQDFSCFFDRTWLLNAYNEVTYGSRKVKVVGDKRCKNNSLFSSSLYIQKSWI